MVDYDGAPHPNWGVFNSPIKFNYRQPQITSCKVLCTDIAKIMIEGKPRYVVVMIRGLSSTSSLPDSEGRKYKKEKERFIIITDSRQATYKGFLTIYDPRTATEYQCGWKTDSEIEKLRGNASCNIQDATLAVGDSADNNELILGPAITPRLVINVYNYKGKRGEDYNSRNEELLGSCQVSISSVLSGSGLTDQEWVTLHYKDVGGGPAEGVDAGEIQVEMSFKGKEKEEKKKSDDGDNDEEDDDQQEGAASGKTKLYVLCTVDDNNKNKPANIADIGQSPAKEKKKEKKGSGSDQELAKRSAELEIG